MQNMAKMMMIDFYEDWRDEASHSKGTLDFTGHLVQ
jgi:hypothetical protein